MTSKSFLDALRPSQTETDVNAAMAFDVEYVASVINTINLLPLDLAKQAVASISILQVEVIILREQVALLKQTQK